jgi:hypothetical protein
VREADLALYTGFLRTLAPQERRRSEREHGRQELLIGPAEEALTTEEIAGAFERFVGRGGQGGRP